MFSVKLTLFTIGAAAGVEAAEIDVEIFDLGAPVAQEGVFEAAADGPAELVAGCRGRDAANGVVVALTSAVGAAAGDVRQPAIEGIADPAAEGGEPVVRGLAGDNARDAGDAALHVGPAEVAFEAVDDRAGLIVVAKRAADQEALGFGVGPGRQCPSRGAEAVAGVDADVEARSS